MTGKSKSADTCREWIAGQKNAVQRAVDWFAPALVFAAAICISSTLCAQQGSYELPQDPACTAAPALCATNQNSGNSQSSYGEPDVPGGTVPDREGLQGYSG